MTSPTQDTSVANQPERNRYELSSAGSLAGFLAYSSAGRHVDLVHTEIFPEYEGKGLASQLVRQALDDLRACGQKVVPSCSYVATFVSRNPQYQDLLAPAA